MNLKVCLGVMLFSAANCAFADVSYQEAVRYTGGSLVDMMKGLQGGLLGKMGGNKLNRALENQTYKVYLKGSKMARIGQELSTIFDLDAGTITTIDHQKQAYSKMTFEEMKQRMEQAKQRMSRNGAQNPDLQFDTKVDETGNSRSIDGQTAKECVMNLTAQSGSGDNGQNAAMKVRSDMWVVPSVAGLEELRAFQARLANQMGMVSGFNPAMGAANTGLAQLTKEAQKIHGFPLMQDVAISGVQSPMSAMMMGNKSAADDNTPFLTMNMESSNFSDASVVETVFQIPDGYKEQKTKR